MATTSMKKALQLSFVVAAGLWLLLLASPALAQAAPSRPACYPLVNGYPVGAPQMLAGTHGRHLFWFCSDVRGGPVRAEGVSCLRDQCSEVIAGQAIAAVTRASAKVGAANNLWDQHVQFNCPSVEAEDSPRGLLCRERRAILTANRTAWGVQ